MPDAVLHDAPGDDPVRARRIAVLEPDACRSPSSARPACPVAGNVSSTATGMLTTLAGTTPAAAVGRVAFGSATTVSWIGPTGSGRGVTTIVADGRRRYAPTAATRSARPRIAAPMSHGVRIPPRPTRSAATPAANPRWRDAARPGWPRMPDRRRDRAADGLADDRGCGRCAARRDRGIGAGGSGRSDGRGRRRSARAYRRHRPTGPPPTAPPAGRSRRCGAARRYRPTMSGRRRRPRPRRPRPRGRPLGLAHPRSPRATPRIPPPS